MADGTKKFTEGAMWEGYPWRIEFNHECSGYSGTPCRHCHGDHVVAHKRHDGSQFTERKWICPRVVVALNEAGYNSTGVCLDCILKAVKDNSIAQTGEQS